MHGVFVCSFLVHIQCMSFTDVNSRCVVMVLVLFLLSIEDSA